MNLNEKTAFLKGLMEGMNFDTETNEGKLISKLVEIVDDIAHEIEYLDEKTDVQSDYLEELDHDLGEVEECVYNCDDDDECDGCECYDFDDDACLCEGDCDDCDWDDEDECDCGCCCDCEDDEDFEDDLYEIECPSCHDKIYASEDMLKDSLLCPNCNEKLCDIEIED